MTAIRLLWCAAAILSVATTQSAEAALRAGAARVSITPTSDTFPYTVQHEKSFVGVHDDVFARALVIDDGKRRVVIVSLEVTTIPNAKDVIDAVAAAAKTDSANVMVTATHTHSVPLVFFHGGTPTPVQARELAKLRDAAVDAARQAVAALTPATVGWTRGQAFVNTNNGEEGGRKYWYDPTGSSDKSLDILRVSDAQGKPIGLILNYATHGEVMFRSVTKDGGYEVTGDLPGAVSRLLESQPTGAPVVLFTSAAEADQLPLFKSLQPAAQFPATDEGAAGWGLLDLQARRLAAAALETVATMPAGRGDARVDVRSATAMCPGQHFDIDHATGSVRSIQETPPVAIPLQVVRVGDVALAGVAGDLSSDIGRSIKAASPDPRTSVVTMLAGSVGYILNDPNYTHPGHGAYGSPVKAGCGKIVTDALSTLLRQGR